jgi:outer membrane receptor protein involved in Fe transport
MNINGGYEWQNSKLELFVNNVFDRSYETNNSLQTSAGIPVVRMGAPRLIGARATFSF